VIKSANYTLDMEANSGGNGKNKMSIGQYARVISASVKITVYNNTPFIAQFGLSDM
jgi:hypothetical protein